MALRTTMDAINAKPLFAAARRTDPQTSHEAAAHVDEFAGDHERRILEALAQGPACRNEIARRARMPFEAVWRRLAELERRGEIEKTGRTVRVINGRRQTEYRRVSDGR